MSDEAHERVGIVTVFPNKYAESAREIPLDTLLDTLRNPPMRPSKEACELFVAARIGTLRTEHNSLRSDDNVIEVVAVTGDYDGGQVSIATARDRLEVLHVRAAFYTSASHTPERPRWRVIAPLSAPMPKDAHPRLAARLNAALGGILATESRTLSQPYFFGRVNGHEYIHAESAGEYLDRLPELDDLIPPEAAAAGGTANPERDSELRAAVLAGILGKVYPALRSLTARHIVRGVGAADIIAALQTLLDECPWKRRDPKTWQKRYTDIPKLVASAAKKFADPRERDREAHDGHHGHDEHHCHDDGEPGVQGDEDAAGALPTETEMEIAVAFTRRGTGSLLYVAGMDWFTNAGPRWQRDEKLARFTLANKLCRTAGSKVRDSARARIETNKTAAAIVNIARPDLIAVPADFDRIPYELNTPKGVIDLRYGTMRRRASADWFMHCTGAVPDSHGIAGTEFADFLAAVTCGDGGLAKFLQTMLGATLFVERARRSLVSVPGGHRP